MKFLEFNANHKNNANLIILHQHYESHEICRIERQINENHEIHRITHQDNENHEILIIP